MTIYTLIAYKESYRDSRREEYYPSELDCIQIFDDLEGAANKILWYKIENKTQNAWLSDWEYQLLVDGRDWDYWNVDFWDHSTNEYLETDPFKPVHDKATELYDDWLSKAKEREEAAKLEANAKREREQAATAKRVIAAEKKLLQELKGKYPNG